MKKITAIILAAGQGTRLRPLTDKIPKCMVEVAGKPMLHHQLDSLEKAGIKDIIVVTGYKEDEIIDPRIKRKVFNPDYASSNMIYSLFCAENEINGKLLICYGDIIYSQKVLTKVLNAKHDITVASDEDWLAYWSERFEDPLDDVESFKKGENNRVRSIGQKAKTTEEIEGQFIGLMKFSAKGAELLKKAYYDCQQNPECNESAWNSGRNLKNAYMTDMMNHFALEGKLHYASIRRGWFEVDDPSDLKIVEKNYNSLS